MCTMVAALFFLSVGFGSVWILVQIGGRSDGPGALIFYIGAFFGLLVGFSLLGPALSGSRGSEEG